MKQFYIKLKKRIAFSCFFLIKSFKYFISEESIDDAIDVLRVCYPILPIPFFILVEYFDPIASVGLIVESFIVIKFFADCSNVYERNRKGINEEVENLFKRKVKRK